MNSILAFLNDTAQKLIDIFWPKQAFSWQTVFWLSVFSWGLAWLSANSIGNELLPSDAQSPETGSPSSEAIAGASRILFTMAWVFLTVAIGWVLASQKIKIPILDVTVKPAIWVTSALTSGFLFEIWKPNTSPMVFMAWPIIFALYAIIPKVFSLTAGRFVLPSVPVRQHLVITTLICVVISCLFRFHFTLQDWIRNDYPILQIVDVGTRGQLRQVNPPQPVMGIAYKTLQYELGGLSIPEVRRWMVRDDRTVPDLNAIFQKNLESVSDVSTMWDLTIVVQKVSSPQFDLYLWPREPDFPIGIMQRCQVQSTTFFSPEELEQRAEFFNQLPEINASEQPESTESPNQQQTPEQGQDVDQELGQDQSPERDPSLSEDSSDSQSLAEQAWQRLQRALGLSEVSIPSILQGEENQESSDQNGQSDPDSADNDFLTPRTALFLRDNPSQVVCQPPDKLVSSDDDALLEDARR
jgi:hypothetical protein